MENWGIALVGLWVPAVVNLAGVRQMAWFQNVTVVLKFLPLLFVGVVGWFFVHKANFGPFNASGGSLYSGIGIAAGVALFSFIGVEAAAITAKRVKNPRRNVGRASVLGTGGQRHPVRAGHRGGHGSGAPPHAGQHRIAVRQRLPDASSPTSAWAGKFIAALAVVSGIGALNGWTLIVTETSRAIAQDDLFPRPFAWADRKGTAWFGIVVGTVLPSLLMLWRYTTNVRPDGVHLPGRPHRGHRGHPVLHSRPSPSSPTSSRAVGGCRAGRWPATCRSPGRASCSRCG